MKFDVLACVAARLKLEATIDDKADYLLLSVSQMMRQLLHMTTCDKTSSASHGRRNLIESVILSTITSTSDVVLTFIW